LRPQLQGSVTTRKNTGWTSIPLSATSHLNLRAATTTQQTSDSQARTLHFQYSTSLITQDTSSPSTDQVTPSPSTRQRATHPNQFLGSHHRASASISVSDLRHQLESTAYTFHKPCVTTQLVADMCETTPLGAVTRWEWASYEIARATGLADRWDRRR
jgi:hypothetical protein